jgi:hypothetical protein
LEYRINLFVAVEALPSCHNAIVNMFLDAIMDKINDMVCTFQLQACKLCCDGGGFV